MWKKLIVEYSFLWVFGGGLYYICEIIYRGFSHISMFILGGFCMDFFALQGRASKWREPLWKQIIRCTIFVISSEFLTGIFVNKVLKLHVWDYSNEPFQIMGQICLPFAIIFSILCAFGIIICGYLLHFLFGEEKPRFTII